MTPLSRRVCSIAPSATLEISETVSQLRVAGIHVHDLGLGEADFPAPAAASEALARIAASRQSRTTEGQGAIELRRAIARSLNRTFYDQTGGNDHLPCFGPNEVLVGAGSRHLQYTAIQALCDPGDEVLLFAPYWESYLDRVQMADATPVVVSAGPETGFIPSIDDIEAAITERTRLVFLNSPANPTGRVWTRSQIGELCELILAHDGVYLVSDEIYAGLVFDGARHVSPVTYSERMRARTILTSGLSRTHAMGGWRVGYAAIADRELMAGMRRIAASTISCLPSIIQDAAVHALEDRSHVCGMRIEFERRARRFNHRLNAMGLPALPTQGGFHAFADVSSLFGAEVHGKPMHTSLDVARALLADARVACVAGEAFGDPGHIRFSFVRPLTELDAACDAIEAFVLRHRSAALSTTPAMAESDPALEQHEPAPAGAPAPQEQPVRPTAAPRTVV